MCEHFFYGRKLYLATETKYLFKRLEQYFVPGTHLFSNFSDKARLEAGDGNCCGFAIVTGVHQGAHNICLARYQVWDQWKSCELEQKNKISVTKKTEVEVFPGTYLIVQMAKMSFFCWRCNTCAKRPRTTIVSTGVVDPPWTCHINADQLPNSKLIFWKSHAKSHKKIFPSNWNCSENVCLVIHSSVNQMQNRIEKEISLR